MIAPSLFFLFSFLLKLKPPLQNGTMEDKPLVVSKQKTEVVCGVPTQVVCTAFSSHILVVVTQFGKMGTLVSLEPSNVANDISKPVLTTKVLLGQDEVMGIERIFFSGVICLGIWGVLSAHLHTHPRYAQ